MPGTYAATRTELVGDSEGRSRALEVYGKLMADGWDTTGEEVRLGTLSSDRVEVDEAGNAWALLGGGLCLLRDGDAEAVRELEDCVG